MFNAIKQINFLMTIQVLREESVFVETGPFYLIRPGQQPMQYTVQALRGAICL